MRRALAAILAAFGAVLAIAPSAASAQPADFAITAADGSPLPAGIRTKRTEHGSVYVDARGEVLYGMDMRTVLRWAPDPSKYCAEACGQDWQPLLAPVGMAPNIRFPDGSRMNADDGFVDPRKASDWTVIAGTQGPQWVYKGWHLVFTRKSGNRASTAFDGADNMTWNTLKYVPAVPKVDAPGGVTAAFIDGAYALTDKDGRVLFTGKCGRDCRWHPLPAPMASSGSGDWKVALAGDRPEWTLRGKPVFVAADSDPHAVPPGGKILRP